MSKIFLVVEDCDCDNDQCWSYTVAAAYASEQTAQQHVDRDQHNWNAPRLVKTEVLTKLRSY